MLSFCPDMHSVYSCYFVKLAILMVLFVCSARAQTSVSANPSQLNFLCPAGGTQTSQVTSTPSGAQVSIFSISSSVNGLSASVPQNATTPATVSVSMNCTGVSPGHYTNFVNVAVGSSGVQIPVIVDEPTGTTFTVTPNSLTFNAQVGGSSPPSQPFTVSATGGTVNYSATASSSPSWLSVSPGSGTASPNAPGTLTVTANPAGLTAAGSPYSGTITVSAAGSPTVTRTVTFNVSPGPTLNTPSPSQIPFTFQVGSSPPAPVPVSITSSGGSLNYSASVGCSWVTLTGGNGATPGTIQVGVNPAGMAVGSYPCSVTVSATGSPSVQIMVSLTIPRNIISASPSSLTFSCSTGSRPAAQTVTLGTDNNPVNFSASATPSWLSVSPASGTIPQSISISVDCSTLSQSTNGTVSVVAPAAVNSPANISVAVTVSSTVLSVSPSSLTFTPQPGSVPPAQSFSVTSTPTGLPFNITSGLGCAWASLSPSSGSTPASITVTPGTTNADTICSETITLTGTSVSGTVQLHYIPPVPTQLLVNPASLSFIYTIGAAAPASQPITVGSSSPSTGVAFTATPQSGCGWLNLSAAGGTTPTTLTASVNTSVVTTANNYSCQVIFNGPNLGSPQTVGFNLTAVTLGQILVSPNSLVFNQIVGGSPDGPKSFSVSSNTAGSFNITPGSGCDWLNLSPSSGTLVANSPLSITGSVVTGNRSQGQYPCTETVSSGGSQALFQATLNVNPPSSLVVTPQSIPLGYQIGGTPPTASFSVSTNPSGSTSFSVTSGSGCTWLNVSSSGSTTPGQVNLSVVTAGLSSGQNLTCNLQVSAQNVSNSPQAVQVSLTVTNPITGTLSVGPPTTPFSYRLGDPAPPAQNISITSTGSSSGVPYQVTPGPGCGWLNLSRVSGNTPDTISASINIGGLAQNTYFCTLSIAIPGGSATPLTVQASLNVTAAQLKVTSPLTFNYTLGASAPQPQTISVTSVNPTSGVAFTATPNCQWLTLSASSGTTPQDLMASVNTANLGVGNYSCSVLVTSPQASASATSSVNLAVSSPTVIASTNTLVFSATSGSSTPMFKTVSIGANSPPTSYSASASTTDGKAWLSVSPAGGTTPATLTVTADPTGLAPGNYSGSITVTAQGASQTINVSLSISAAPLNVGPTALFMTAQQGNSSTPAVVSVFSANSATLQYTAAGSDPWLSVSKTGSNITVVANAASLQAGTYNSSVVVSAIGTNPLQQLVPVNLTVTAPPAPQPVLSAATTSIGFNFAQGGSPESNTIQVSNLGGGSLNFTASAIAVGATQWLSVSPVSGTATPANPTSITVTANPTGLAPTSYSGQVIISGAGQTISIPVTMTVAASTQTIQLSEASISFTTVVRGANPPSHRISILNSGGGTMAWSVTPRLNSGNGWLSVTPSSGSAVAGVLPPSFVDISVNVAGLATGTYYGSVLISAAGAPNSPMTISVVLSVLDTNVELIPLLQPAAVIFPGAFANTSADTQTVTVYNLRPVPLSFNTTNYSVDGNWFTVSPSSGTIPASGTTVFTVQRTSAAPAGSSSGTGRVLFADGTFATVTVESLGANPTSTGATAVPLLAGPNSSRSADLVRPQATSSTCPNVNITSLSDNFSVTVSVPVSITVMATDCSGRPLNGLSVKIQTSNGDKVNNDQTFAPGTSAGQYVGEWTPSQVSTSVHINPIAVAAGVAPTYGPIISGQITSSSVPRTVINGVANSGSYSPAQVVAPGTWISMFGDNLANGTAGATTIPFSTNLNGTEVRLNDRLLPLYVVAPGQINAEIPFDLPPNAQHTLIVNQNGVQSDSFLVSATDKVPALFTFNAQGFGPGAIVDTTNTPVTPDHPAHAGDTVAIYCTGLGSVDQAIGLGDAAPANPPAQLTNPITVLIDGQPAHVLFAGLSPGSVALYQINIEVPAAAAAGDLSVVIQIGSQNSQPGVTLSVQ
jgi:uncharacterized protein (TIGR03437 family)